MGLPAKYNDPEHGLCLTLHAALAYLKEHDITHERDGETIIVYTSDTRSDKSHAPRYIEPITLALGKMYPVSAFE